MKFFILLFSLLITITVNGACISDILAVGLSADSVRYDGETPAGDLTTLASNMALGAKAAWVTFCPDKGLEYQLYGRLRTYSFSDITAQQVWGGVSDKLVLPSIGAELRKFYPFFNQPFELTADVELRDEMGFGITAPSFPGETYTIFSEHYLNLKVMGGLRYFAWSDEKRDVTVLAKLGILKGLSSLSKLGIIYGISSEYLQRMGRRTSFKADLYFDRYAQDYDELSMTRTELGLRFNMIYRL